MTIVTVKLKGRITMFGYIKGHEVFTANKKKINRPEFTVRLCGYEDEIRENAIASLASHGVVYCLKNKQKECVCVYCFEKITDPDGNGKRLVLRAKYTAENYENIENEFVKLLHEELKEMLLFTDVNSVEWNGSVITAKDVEDDAKGTLMAHSGMLLALALIFWQAFDSIILGVIFACLAILALAEDNLLIKKAKRKSESVIEESDKNE